MRLSVLDQSPIPSGSSGGDALRNSIDLARRCEGFGYHRYWVAEHHNTGGLAGSAPEILIAHIAEATERIRVGSGGVMMPHYAPYKVAETFRVLAALHPGRIDLGHRSRARLRSGRDGGARPRPSAHLDREVSGHDRRARRFPPRRPPRRAARSGAE